MSFFLLFSIGVHPWSTCSKWILRCSIMKHSPGLLNLIFSFFICSFYLHYSYSCLSLFILNSLLTHESCFSPLFWCIKQTNSTFTLCNKQFALIPVWLFHLLLFLICCCRNMRCSIHFPGCTAGRVVASWWELLPSLSTFISIRILFDKNINWPNVLLNKTKKLNILTNHCIIDLSMHSKSVQSELKQPS